MVEVGRGKAGEENIYEGRSRGRVRFTKELADRKGGMCGD